MKILKLFLNALVAWTLGLASIAVILYFSNEGADFTITDISGFGVLAIVVSGLLMAVLYLPGLYWLKRRRGGVKPRIAFLLLAGVLCNVPVFIFLLTLSNRKMVLTEALGFIATFLIIGSAFGLGFTFCDESSVRGMEPHQSGPERGNAVEPVHRRSVQWRATPGERDDDAVL